MYRQQLFEPFVGLEVFITRIIMQNETIAFLLITLILPPTYFARRLLLDSIRIFWNLPDN